VIITGCRDRHKLEGAAGKVTGHSISRTREALDAGQATMSLSALALAVPAISFVAGPLGTPNAQVWMADVLIGSSPM
jgi:hypothetical protein